MNEKALEKVQNWRSNFQFKYIKKILWNVMTIMTITNIDANSVIVATKKLIAQSHRKYHSTKRAFFCYMFLKN